MTLAKGQYLAIVDKETGQPVSGGHVLYEVINNSPYTEQGLDINPTRIVVLKVIR
jgi:hypothetical protein